MDGLELLQEHKVPSSGAVKRAGQQEQRERWLQVVEAGFCPSDRFSKTVNPSYEGLGAKQ